MPLHKLHSVLDELHRQLESGEPIDEPARQRLAEAMEEVRQVLERTKDSPSPTAAPDDGNLIGRLRHWVEHFEVEHPTLSAGLSDLITSLRNMGF